jgi:microcystin-dependent protein
LGQSGGSATATVSQAQLGSHTHGWQAVNTTATSQSPAGNALSNTAYSTSGRTRTPVGAQAYGAASNLVSLGSLEDAGSGAAPSHYNVQPRQAISYIIALNGTFPSRA